jgi:hypothetical protein
VNQNAYAVFGALLGAGVVTGLGMWVAARNLQRPETQAHAQEVATAEANRLISDVYGLTPERMRQFQAIARRFGGGAT